MRNEPVNIRELIQRDGYHVCVPLSSSMMPLLRMRRDSVYAVKPAGRLKRYDIALYQADSGMLILHRILRRQKSEYVLRGDNCRTKESGITDADIVGVARGIYRDERYIPCSSFLYRLYSHLWCDLFLVRYPLVELLKKARHFLKA